MRKVVFEEEDGEREESAEATERTVITAESKASAWRKMFNSSTREVVM
jgi:hypothetical protein